MIMFRRFISAPKSQSAENIGFALLLVDIAIL